MSYGHKGVGGEVPLSQCDKCGSEVPPDHIDWDKQYNHIDCFKVFVFGIIVGGFASSFIMWLRFG